MLVFCVSLLTFASTVSAQDETVPAASPVADAVSPPELAEPEIVAASSEAADAIASFKKPDGWICELFAAEPDVANPVTFTVDNQGRIWVCESFRQNKGVTDNRGHDDKWLMADLAAKTVKDRIKYHRELLGEEAAQYTKYDDRIRVLIDKDQDGKVDESVVFADHFNQLEDGTGAGILIHGSDVFFTCIPKLWRLRDSDGDLKADTRDAVYDGFGVRVAFRGHDMHGLTIGPDGRLYFSIGDRGYHVQTADGLLADPESGAVFRCELDGSRLEVFATGLRNPQELAFDDYGNLFTGDNNSDSGDKARWVYVVQGGDTGWRMMYQYLPDRGPFNREKIWNPYSPETPAYIIPPIANFADGPSGLVYYPGTGLGPEYKGMFFLCDFRGQSSNSGIRSIRVAPKGAFFEISEDAQPIWNILATDVDFGPDGSMYVIDWVNGWNGEGKGRVYRFRDMNAAESEVVKDVARILSAGVKESTIGELLEYLGHPDRRVRQESQLELVSRRSIDALVDKLNDQSAPSIARLHAVWALGHLHRISASDRAVIEKAIENAIEIEDKIVAAGLLQVVADIELSSVTETVVEYLKSEEPRLQYLAAIAVGKLHTAQSLPAVISLLESNADADPILRHGGIMALAGMPDHKLVAGLATHPSKSVRLAAVVALRKRMNPMVAEFLNDSEPTVAVEAARAIHDLPALHDQLPKLAAQLALAPNDDAMLRRCLNAHFRLGKPENAAAIAAFATSAARPDSLRIEALNMLASWAEPGKLDRVMNRYQPLENRDSEVAKTSLQSQITALAGSPDAVRTRAFEIAATLGITEIAPQLAAIVNNNQASDQQRAQALLGLVKLQKEDSKELLSRLINDSAAAVRSVSLRELAKLDSDAALPGLISAIQSDDMLERQTAWDTLATLDSPQAIEAITKGAEDYISGNLPNDVLLNVREAAEAKLGDDWKSKITEYVEKRKSENEIEAYADSLMGGDAEAGQRLFFTRTELSCVRCHKVGDVGGEVGPVLTEIAKQKNAEYLLESIVYPNAKIAQNFETAVIVTEDDRIQTGIVKSENDDEVKLLTAEGQLITVLKDEIVGRKAGQSSMPADLTKYMTPRELRDLVAYLGTLDGTRLPSSEIPVGGHPEK